eukprot:1537356-Pyramimonas_sp.AAC.1
MNIQCHEHLRLVNVRNKLTIPRAPPMGQCNEQTNKQINKQYHGTNLLKSLGIIWWFGHSSLAALAGGGGPHHAAAPDARPTRLRDGRAAHAALHVGPDCLPGRGRVLRLRLRHPPPW